LVRMTTGDGGTHFYTTSAAEKAQFQSQGWKDEGIVGYIWNQ